MLYILGIYSEILRDGLGSFVMILSRVVQNNQSKMDV